MLFVIIGLGICFIQGICALLAVRFRTDKLTDIAYGGTFFLLMWWLYLGFSAQEGLYTLLVICISLWAIRLAGYLFLRVLALGKDKRFDGIREKKRSFAKFRLLQTAVIFLLMVPILFVFSAEAVVITWWTWGGCLLVLGGVVGETLADWQKFRFKQQYPTRPCTIGLWKKVQYPNYLCEIIVWVGIYLICLASLQGSQVIWGLISQFTITWLLLFVTGIPPLETMHEKKRGSDPEWRNYTENTPKIFPYIY